ncbi:hypothetical protein [Clostridium sp. BJN0001]|uniref:hypothetical protein n=1 Tax=Clostridium sp. BJN0001 TaxID=2930219 RepID=UPI001FD200D8|nr:hypothetical protein [Clostridium sp. BJN0001]
MSFDNRILAPIRPYSINSIKAIQSIKKIKKEEKRKSFSKEKKKNTDKNENEFTFNNFSNNDHTLDNLPKNYDINLRNSILQNKEENSKKKSDSDKNPKIALHKKLNDAMNINVSEDLKNIIDKIEYLVNKK